ncbi:hypothetical protein, partial [Mesorhizobium sp. M2D.F.Ca.ET.224.01.1.1]|uniref:hypothetical protein n=1 Tax=Mesorhizobium sp. M2D.F.Ca.ET.224.01.1.1 TaxID=2563941 RepID=UPI0010939A1F
AAADIPGTNCFGVIGPFADQPALAEGSARFRGEAVALVAGEREAILDLDLTDFPVSWTDDAEAVVARNVGGGEDAGDAGTGVRPGPDVAEGE